MTDLVKHSLSPLAQYRAVADSLDRVMTDLAVWEAQRVAHLTTLLPALHAAERSADQKVAEAYAAAETARRDVVHLTWRETTLAIPAIVPAVVDGDTEADPDRLPDLVREVYRAGRLLWRLPVRPPKPARAEVAVLPRPLPRVSAAVVAEARQARPVVHAAGRAVAQPAHGYDPHRDSPMAGSGFTLVEPDPPRPALTTGKRWP